MITVGKNVCKLSQEFPERESMSQSLEGRIKQRVENVHLWRVTKHRKITEDIK